MKSCGTLNPMIDTSPFSPYRRRPDKRARRSRPDAVPHRSFDATTHPTSAACIIIMDAAKQVDDTIFEHGIVTGLRLNVAIDDDCHTI